MIRRSAVAGMFYPADRERLHEMVSAFISQAGEKKDRLVRGIVSPHAGYIYSGAVAGSAYAKAPAGIRNVVIIAPPHRYPVRGASVFDGEGYETPLGTAAVNREITSRLLKAGYQFVPEAHRSEHSAEVQIPFAQVKWPECNIVVILQGSVSSGFNRELAQAIADSIEDVETALVVASSDLSHYHDQDVAEKKDRIVIQGFLSGDPSSMEDALLSGGEACGMGPILTLMHYGKLTGCSRFGEIEWDTSASASGDRSSVVGYFAGYCGMEEE